MKNILQHKKIYYIQYEVSLFVKYYNVKNTRNTDIYLYKNVKYFNIT